MCEDCPARNFPTALAPAVVESGSVPDGVAGSVPEVAVTPEGKLVMSHASGHGEIWVSSL